MKRDTLCIHGHKHESYGTGAITPPIFQSSTFARVGVGEATDHIYSRIQNPTRDAAEKTIAALEGANEGFAFSSGMAAISTVMELFASGDHVIATEDLYGGAIRLFTNQKHGLEFTYVDTGDVNAVKTAIKPNTKAIYLETPTNPLIHVTDIAAIRAAVPKSFIIIVDNTFLTPYLQNPLEHGADIVVHSGTKYLSGHSDALAGFAVANCPKICEELRTNHKSIGACLSPFESFLVVRGIKTLALRMDRIESNTLAIANWLRTHPKIKSVNYAGFPSHPSYEISKKQARGFGGMLSFETDTKETAHALLTNVKIVTYAESLGCVNSLITIPATCTHEDVPIDVRNARGITDKLVRFSVGIENPQDIIDDLAQAMA